MTSNYLICLFVGQVHLKGQNNVIINLASNPQHVSAVRDALVSSSMNINPRIDGSTIYVDIPKVTRESREKMARSAKVPISHQMF